MCSVWPDEGLQLLTLSAVAMVMASLVLPRHLAFSVREDPRKPPMGFDFDAGVWTARSAEV